MPRATISIVFSDLQGAEPDQPISPALPRTLRLLAERDLPAGFVIPDDLATAEPFAVTMIENARHAMLQIPPDAVARASAADAPGAWHAAIQTAVGRAVSSGSNATIAFDLAAVERGDGANLLAESLDLVAGLRRAGSIDVVAPV